MADRQHTDDLLSDELARVAPGTLLREGLEMVISARMGALIVLGDRTSVEPYCSGGFALDVPYTPPRLYELAKMDGAIVLDAQAERLLKANAHLVPDQNLPTSETGMRHRTAERMSRQTDALVIAISQRRNSVHLYSRGHRLALEDTEVLVAKANQALQTLQNYRNRLAEVLGRLTLLEFEDVVTLGDLTEAVSRFEMVRRVAREVGRYTLQLGTEGRLVRMQADELTAGIVEEYTLLIRDYADDPSPRRAGSIRARLGDLGAERLLEPMVIAHEMGLSVAEHAEQLLHSRGFRILSQIPTLPTSVIGRIVERFGHLPEVARAGIDALDDVDGVGERRARAIVNGLARIRTHIAR